MLSAGEQFADALIEGSVSGIIEGLVNIGGIIASIIFPVFAPLIAVASALLGRILGRLADPQVPNQQATRAAGAQARSAPALELNFTFNQSLALASLTDPDSRSALNQSATDAFTRFERVIQTNVLPRLDRLEARA